MSDVLDIVFDIPPITLPIWESDATEIGLYGGRGSAKSETAARKFIYKIITEPERDVKYGCFREVQNSIKESSKSLLERIVNQSNLNKYFLFTETKMICTLTNVPVVFSGLLEHTTDSIKSLDRLKYAWIEEAQSVSQNSLDKIIPTIIRNENSQICYTWNPEYDTTPIHKHLIVNAPKDSLVIEMNYDENPFLNKKMLERIEELKNTNYELWLHIYKGKFKTENKNAIWTQALIDQHRIHIPFDKSKYKSIAIGVDPSGGSKKKSKSGGNDEWGIVVCAMDYNNVGTILNDSSGTYKPKQASQIISNLYERYECGSVVAEDNYGGEMVGTVIKECNQNIFVVLVRSTKSKRYRANPILNKNQLGFLKFLGKFGILEYQMTNWDEDADYSPDRMDAAVIVLTHLYGKNISMEVYAV